METSLRARGFLPAQDPARAFQRNPEFAYLDELGQDLPSYLEDPDFRARARSWALPLWPEGPIDPADLPELRLAYVRLGFLASGYINQIGQEPARILPANLALPLHRVATLLERPPILSYDGYALYNWKRFDPDQAIALGNIDTIQNFVHMYDEHWFILIHIEIEAIAARILDAIAGLQDAIGEGKEPEVNPALETIAAALWQQVKVLQRIPEKMDPALYYKTFRPYIRFFEDVIYDGVDAAPMQYRGETGAQSSILPALTSLMKIPHKPTALTNHLQDMRNYMPAQHRAVLAEIEALPDFAPNATPERFNEVLEAMATFREVHHGWAKDYIADREPDPRGTGGTPFMQWLGQLVDETRQRKIGA